MKPIRIRVPDGKARENDIKGAINSHPSNGRLTYVCVIREGDLHDSVPNQVVLDDGRSAHIVHGETQEGFFEIRTS